VASLSTPALVGVFVAAAVATWLAGVQLSKTTDVLDRRFKLGDAVGGIVLLGIAGTLPEIAITVSASASGHLDLAAGNLIGGIAMQTMIITVCDAVASRDESLSYLVGSLIPVVEGLLVVLLICGVLMGALLPASVRIGPVSPASLVIVVLWLAGIYVLTRAQRAPAWSVAAPGSRPGRRRRHSPLPKERQTPATTSARRAGLVFAISSIVTLGAGVALATSSSELASRGGINGVVFGATVLAFATGLPEISSGIAAVRFGDNQLALADVFGGNAFQVCLFLLADLVAGKPVLRQAGSLNAWLAALGAALTLVYAFGVIVRPRRSFLRLGADSWVAVATFAVGIAGLVVISHHHP
jgi:cation:H+ antiporter